MADETRKWSFSPNIGNTEPEKTQSDDVFKFKRRRVVSSHLHFDDNKGDNLVDSNANHFPKEHPSEIKNGQVFPGCHESKEENFINILSNYQRGQLKPSSLNKVAEQMLVKQLLWFRAYETQDVTDRQVSAIAWHPTNPRIFVCGGTAGTLMLFRSEPVLCLILLYPHVTLGIRSPVECIRFMTKRGRVEICVASQDGAVTSHDLEAEISNTLVDSKDQRVSFCALDIHSDGKSIYGADCLGNLAIHHHDSGKTEYGPQHLKLHTNKIRHLEFSARDPNLMVTASLDKTVKLWDIRKLDGNKSCIESLNHDCGVASAKFSRTDGNRLLTTDLYSQIRVYKAPTWSMEHKIIHPHRHHHVTVIRASWHPRADLFVVGRYPDPKLMGGDATHQGHDDLRSIDVYSATSGKLCHQLVDTSKLITSLAEFNSTGGTLASTTGRHFHFLKSERIVTRFR